MTDSIEQIISRVADVMQLQNFAPTNLTYNSVMISGRLGFNPTTKTGAIILTNQAEADLDHLFVDACKLGDIL